MAIKLRTIKTANRAVPLRVAKGHFATSHSHINYYIDLAKTKHTVSEAKEAAKQLAANYKINTIVDTILCLDGTETIGTCMALELAEINYVVGIIEISRVGEAAQNLSLWEFSCILRIIVVERSAVLLNLTHTRYRVNPADKGGVVESSRAIANDHLAATLCQHIAKSAKKSKRILATRNANRNAIPCFNHIVIVDCTPCFAQKTANFEFYHRQNPLHKYHFAFPFIYCQ